MDRQIQTQPELRLDHRHLWNQPSNDQLERVVCTLSRVFDLIRASDGPRLASDIRGSKEDMGGAKRPPILLLLVTDDDRFAKWIGGLLANHDVLLRCIAKSSFEEFYLDEQLLKNIERDVWLRKVACIVSVVLDDGLNLASLDAQRLNWLRFVDRILKHSPVLVSYSSRDEVTHGLAFLDEIHLKISADVVSYADHRIEDSLFHKTRKFLVQALDSAKNSLGQKQNH